jgi:hypothetical protein
MKPPTAATMRWLLVLLSVCLYLPTVRYGLVNYDDPWLVRDNPYVRDGFVWRHLQSIWFDLRPVTRLKLGSEYLPVRDMSVLADYALYGQWFGGHHLTNVLLYAGIIWALGRVVFRRIDHIDHASLAVAIYAAHPLHVESVAWLSERKGLLACFGVLLAWDQLDQWLTTRRPRFALLTICFLVLAIWSKAVALFAVGLFWCVLWLDRTRERHGGFQSERGDQGRSPTRARTLGAHRLARPVLAIALATTGLAAFAPVWRTGKVVHIASSTSLPFVGRLVQWFDVHGLYLKHAALMGPLGIDYAVSSVWSTRAWWGLATFVLAVLLLAGLLGRLFVGVGTSQQQAANPVPRGVVSSWPGTVSLGIALWLVFLFPVSHLLVPLQNLAADRYMLLPSIGFCMVLGVALPALGARIPRTVLYNTLVVVFFVSECMLTLLQSHTWSSDRLLYEQALRANIHNIDAWMQLVRIEREAGAVDRAHIRLLEAERRWPDHSRVLIHRALLENDRGNQPAAVHALNRAVAIDPTSDQARANLALLIRRQDPMRALALAEQAVRIRPLKHHNHYTLGVVLFDLGRWQDAQRCLLRARELQPAHVPTTVYLRKLHALRGPVPQGGSTGL